jgi:hypothetical protein
MMRKCSAKKCRRHHYARGYCKLHYAQVARHGRLTPERERGEPTTCSAPRCDRMGELEGHCRKHARQIRTHGRLTPEIEHAVGVYDHCTVGRCRAPHRAKGLCAKHYGQARGRKLASVTS